MHQEDNTQTRLGWSLEERDPQFIQTLMPFWEWFYHHYFRVQTSGWEHIPEEGRVLLVGSHNGGMAAPDMFMMMYDWFRRFGYDRPVYGLMHPLTWQIAPNLARLAAKTGAILAHPKMASAALRRGASLLVYPGGPKDLFRPYEKRHQIYFAGRQGFIKLALREEVPIVPVISIGAHDTFIVIADLYEKLHELNQLGIPWPFGIDPQVFPIYLGLPWGLAIGPLPHIPLPVRVYTRVCPQIVFERYGEEAARDREYVHSCYQLVCTQMQQELDNLVKQSQE